MQRQFHFLSSLDSFYFLFFALITLNRTSSTMLNVRGESGHLCLIPDLGGEVFSLSLLSIMLAVALSYVTFTMLIYASHQLNQNYFRVGSATGSAL